MIRLVGVEMRRLVWRRAVVILVAAALVIPVVIGVARVLNTAPPSADDVANAKAAIEEQKSEQWFIDEVENCVKHPGRWGIRNVDDVEAACEQQMGLSLRDYLYYDKLRLVEEREAGTGIAIVVILSILMLLAGATFAGHDWASGSVSNQLLFEPRRLRVWAAKGLVITAGALAISAAVMTGYWLALYAAAMRRDLDVRDGVLLDCLQMGWRGAAIAAFAALGGYALTMLFRSTVAALGVMLALGLAGGLILAAVGIDSVWNPGLNLAAVVMDGAKYWVDAPCPDGGGFCGEERTLSATRGATFLGVLMALGVGASLVSFLRRDVP